MEKHQEPDSRPHAVIRHTAMQASGDAGTFDREFQSSSNTSNAPPTLIRSGVVREAAKGLTHPTISDLSVRKLTG